MYACLLAFHRINRRRKNFLKSLRVVVSQLADVSKNVTELLGCAVCPKKSQMLTLKKEKGNHVLTIPFTLRIFGKNLE